MSGLESYLVKVQDIAARASDFQAKEGSDPQAFSKTVVADLAVLAEAVSELIKRVEGRG